MIEILNLLPALAIVMVINIALGMYAKIGVEKIEFDKTKLINGVIKACIVACSAIGLSYVATVIDFSSVGLNVTPESILNLAIITYIGKDMVNFGKILGVNIKQAED